MRLQKKLALVGVASLLVIGFQNCANNDADTKFTQYSKFAQQAADGHGHPYDGKVYLLLGNNCEDGTKIRGRIVLKNSTSADLVRDNCQEIAPVTLTPSDFQLDPVNTRKLTYKSQTFVNQLIGTRLDLSKVAPEIGPIAFYTPNGYDFGNIPSDTDTAVPVSPLRLYEDGKPLGPAHAFHIDIREVGLGRFSHWKGDLRFTASDNSNPLTNGRVYTWTAD